MGVAVPTLGERFRTLLPQKLLMGLALNVLVCVPYYGLQYVELFSVTLVPATALDRLVPFTPSAAWLYLSLFVLIPIAPALMVSRAELGQYAAGIASLGLLSSIAYLFAPTTVERPTSDSSDPAYRLIVAADRPVNACPSEH